jgi:hypothetical protein
MCVLNTEVVKDIDEAEVGILELGVGFRAAVVAHQDDALILRIVEDLVENVVGHVDAHTLLGGIEEVAFGFVEEEDGGGRHVGELLGREGGAKEGGGIVAWRAGIPTSSPKGPSIFKGTQGSP